MKDEGIPFSFFLGGKKNSKKSSKRKPRNNRKKTKNRKRTKRRATTKKVKSFSKSISKKCICVNGHCKCVIDNSSSTPEGLGYCPNCMPSRIIMRGRDDNLYKLNNNKMWRLIK